MCKKHSEPFTVANEELKPKRIPNNWPTEKCVKLNYEMQVNGQRTPSSFSLSWKSFWHCRKQTLLTALGKEKVSEKHHTAGGLSDIGGIDNLLCQDEPTKPWQSCNLHSARSEKELFPMIHQPGQPTFFGKCSSIDTHWIDLLRVLYNLHHGTQNISDEELKDLTWQ